MSAPTRQYRVAAAFYADHVARLGDDAARGGLSSQRGNRVVVDLDAEQYAELLADADYYAEHMRDPRDVEADTIALSHSAERVARVLRAEGPPPPLPPGERERRDAERDRAEAEAAAATARYHARQAEALAERERERADRRARLAHVSMHTLLRIDLRGEPIDGISVAEARLALDELDGRRS